MYCTAGAVAPSALLCDVEAAAGVDDDDEEEEEGEDAVEELDSGILLNWPVAAPPFEKLAVLVGAVVIATPTAAVALLDINAAAVRDGDVAEREASDASNRRSAPASS